ncbi:1-(5-phosphoribosyl)-5-[(5-phosphoribosylamino)methylideneamino]imidazole-4-carboxamide isomerase [Candidatus Marinamargulisbacteria bacterium SCGC AG-343-K17]|nr:1-(5-phosphoribosyl)-5-[(5-phosphoribosylamino)methylideneamino]imidazole-4-carboxamide isomerase [Candidatus Marinamargulisbacteria bacterium SCGC AG-343-K17]
MTPFSLIPAIDIIDGGLVRLFKGDYDQITEYDMSPLDMAYYYVSLGFKYIHVVDLNGAKDGHLTNLEVIRSIAEIPDLMVQVGGGVRNHQHIETLLDAGVSAVIVGSLFVKDFDLACQMASDFPGHIIAGLDILDDHLAAHGWTERSDLTLETILTQLSDTPLHSIVTTDISKDGTFEGLNFDLYHRMSSLSAHHIIASGGVSTISDVIQLRDMKLPNVTGCIVGKAIIEGKIKQEDITEFI